MTIQSTATHCIGCRERAWVKGESVKTDFVFQFSSKTPIQLPTKMGLCIKSKKSLKKYFIIGAVCSGEHWVETKIHGKKSMDAKETAKTTAAEKTGAK